MKLSLSKFFDIRFSEVDSMGVVWHGSYVAYLEDAREAFGRQYNMGYQRFANEEIYAPIVDIQIKYKSPLRYGMHPEIEIVYVPSESARIIFEYRIFHEGILMATATTTQVFMDLNYNLVLYNPPFFEEWKKEWLSDEKKRLS